MKKHFLFLAFLGIIFITGDIKAQKKFKLQSGDLGKKFSIEQVYNKYNCGGQNISPELSWYGFPTETKSFAITMFDPDAPTGKGWWHWLIFDIPPYMHQLPTGAGSINKKLLPPGIIQSINDYGDYGYGGPCPPPGKAHRYFISVYALNVESLGMKKNSPPDKVYEQILKHSIGKTEIMSTYGR
jgi:Raf kinase inhibitor-like YbhB/YbcL family protein